MSDRHIFALLVITIVWMPLPAGSNWPWAWLLLQLLILSSAIGWLWLYRQGRVELNQAFIQSRPLLVILGLWLGWISLQLLPLPMSWVRLVAPHNAGLVQQVSDSTGLMASTATISVNPQLTLQSLMLSLTFIVFFILCLLLINSRGRIKWILWLVVYCALFQAVFGTLMTLSGIEYHLFGKKIDYTGVATGTFINRNHLAGYLEMALAVGIGLLLAQMRGSRQHNMRQKIRSWVGVMLEKKMQLRLILVMLVIGLVMTHSRMGNTAFFSSLLLTALIWIFFSGRRPKTTTVVLILSLLVVDVYIVGSWFGFEKVVDRLENTSLDQEARVEVNQSLAKQAIPDYGLPGSGLGTFKSVFPTYKDPEISASFLYAHNDYLQFVLEAGAGAALLLVVVMVSLVTAYRAMRFRHDPLYRGLGFASFMGVMAIMLHSSTDFNLQIPANALMFMLMLALAWIGCHANRHGRASNDITT